MKKPSDATSKIRKKRKKTPKHQLELRAYPFRIEANVEESRLLFAVLNNCYELRTILADERKANREVNKLKKQAGEEKPHYISRADQYATVAILAKTEQFTGIHSQVLQNVAVRIDEGYKRFFEALKQGRNVGSPGFIKRAKYRSFTYPQYGNGARLRNGKIELACLGTFAVRDHRKIKGKKKSVTIKWQHGHWWVIITAGVQAKQLYKESPTDKPDTGLDPGLKEMLTDSSGNVYAMPRPLKNAFKQLRKLQKALSRKFEARKTAWEASAKAQRAAGCKEIAPLRDALRSGRLQQNIRDVGRLHTKVANIRQYHHRKNAAIIDNRYARAAIEEHGVKFMFANKKTAQSAADRGLASQKQALYSKLGPERCIGVANQRPEIGGNSQSCLCGKPVPKKLSDRIHNCPHCGLIADRDHVSSNIVELIAFGTVQPQFAAALAAASSGGQGMTTADVEKSKVSVVKATRPGRSRAVEIPEKRQARVSNTSRSTMGGKPTVEDKTSRDPHPKPPGSRLRRKAAE